MKVVTLVMKAAVYLLTFFLERFILKSTFPQKTIIWSCRKKSVFLHLQNYKKKLEVQISPLSYSIDNFYNCRPSRCLKKCV